MSFEPKFYRDAVAGPGDDAERRAQIERQQQERAAERQQQIALQSSPLSDPEERIQLWEKLHALRLPQSATHQLVRVIAAQTNLSIEQVLEAQQRRATLAAGTVPVPASS
jgi:hypothetical protein